MENFLKEHANFKEIYDRLERREEVNASHVDFDLEVITWKDVPGSEVLPSLLEEHDKLVLAFRHVTTQQPTEKENSFNDSDSYSNGMSNGTSLLEDVHLEEITKYPPVSIGKARSLLSLFCLWKEESTRPCTPLWVVCEGKAPECVFLIGSVWSPAQAAFSIHTVSSHGPYGNKNDIPSLGQLLEQYSQTSVCNITTRAYARYNILGTDLLEMTISEPEYGGSVLLDSEWEGVEMVLEVPHGAKCKLLVKAVPGDYRIPCYSMYQELQTLKRFIIGLEKGEIIWTVRSNNSTMFTSKLQRLLLEDGNGGRVTELKKLEDADEETCESQLHQKFIPPRNDLDFTEKLWILLKDAGCLQELKESLQSVVKTLETGDFSPVVHVNNASRLASQIHACYQQQAPVLNLGGTEPLQILIEMGLDKLQRDYTDFFIRQELVLHHQLGFYLESGLSTKDQVERLCRMHNVLEMLVATVMLNLPLESQQALCRLGLKHYESSPSDDAHTFQLLVDANKLHRIYSTCQPCLWRMEVLPTGSAPASLVYQLSVIPPFSALQSSSTDESLIDESGDCMTYYSTRVQHHLIAPL